MISSIDEDLNEDYFHDKLEKASQQQQYLGCFQDISSSTSSHQHSVSSQILSLNSPLDEKYFQEDKQVFKQQDKNDDKTRQDSLAESQPQLSVSQTQEQYDEYGFQISTSSQLIQSSPILSSSKITNKSTNNILEKWQQILPKLSVLVSKQDSSLKEKLRQGIPSSLRKDVWPIIARLDILQNKYKTTSFSDLASTYEFPYEGDINADLARTFPTHSLFNSQESPGRQSLMRILKAISILKPDMGYCQGLNYLTASLLITLKEEEQTYLMTLSILENYACEEIFRDVSCVRQQLFIHDRLIAKFLPKISQKLNDLCVDPLFYATSWYMTLFTAVLPYSYVIRLMDCFLLEKWKIIYRLSLAILKKKEKKILSARLIEEIFAILKDFSDFQGSEDKLFRSAIKDFVFGRKLISDMVKEFNEQHQEEDKHHNIPCRPISEINRCIEAEKKLKETAWSHSQKEELLQQTLDKEEQDKEQEGKEIEKQLENVLDQVVLQALDAELKREMSIEGTIKTIEQENNQQKESLQQTKQ